ncbi:unnamed protein product [Brassicogethes aeneus]|uniref:Uncharacterized protein n=1 Tax=Brassicogethes aeneus TaxID=1431903 RepID=A0A9P0FE02_BRAAE|nr:unnamed protein product [Brassicogethes aeneus]
MLKATRSNTKIYLIGSKKSEILGSKLPCNRQVLSTFFYYHRTLRKTIRDSSRAVIKEVKTFWSKARIPIREEQHAIAKLEKLHGSWNLLKKSSKRKSATQRLKEQNFIDTLEDLFDIAHADALTLIKIEEDRNFLIAQREKKRRGCIMGRDKVLHLKECKAEKRKKEYQLRCEREEQRKYTNSSSEFVSDVLRTSTDLGSDSSYNSDNNFSISSNYNKQMPEKEKVQKRKKVRGTGSTSLITPHLAATLDRANISDRKATFIVTATLQSLGQNVANIPLSRSSLRRARQNARAKLSTNIKNNLQAQGPFIVHWDGKLLHPTIKNVTDSSSNDEDFAKDQDFKWSYPLQNEQKKQKPEEKSSQMRVPLTNIAKIADMTAIQDEIQGVLEFAEKQLEVIQPREDYREILELLIIFLGGTPPRGVRFRSPGALHHARWMAKILYSLKLWMFRGQFKLTLQEEKALKDICIFIIRIYLKNWFGAPLPIQAPRNDLKLLKQLKEYEEKNLTVSQIALEKWKRHLWYLSDHLVALAFFDMGISPEEKERMVIALHENQGEAEPSKRANIINLQKPINGMTIANFVTTNTVFFFRNLGIDMEFLQMKPEKWAMQKSYQDGLEIVKNLRVVNDNAERGVALIEAYSSTITKNEEQKQCLLQVVQEHRQRYPDCNKKTIVKPFDF